VMIAGIVMLFLFILTLGIIVGCVESGKEV